jgi:hypothetical protein
LFPQAAFAPLITADLNVANSALVDYCDFYHDLAVFVYNYESMARELASCSVNEISSPLRMDRVRPVKPPARLEIPCDFPMSQVRSQKLDGHGSFVKQRIMKLPLGHGVAIDKFPAESAYLQRSHQVSALIERPD